VALFHSFILAVQPTWVAGSALGRHKAASNSISLLQAFPLVSQWQAGRARQTQAPTISSGGLYHDFHGSTTLCFVCMTP
jgi:hypothetical protein